MKKNRFKRVKEHGYIIIVDGHTMFPEDIVSSLNRLDYVEKKISGALAEKFKNLIK